MSKELKIYFMGELLKEEEVPDAPPSTAEHWFADVVLSPKAIDLASQIVPDHIWKPVGLHTWLSRKANDAYKAIPVGKKEVQLGKLKYFFKYEASGPVLEKVVLSL